MINHLRIIQSIPPPKAEPFKLWLAQVGFHRFNEIENPEWAAQRTRELYKLKGYPVNWMNKLLTINSFHLDVNTFSLQQHKTNLYPVRLATHKLIAKSMFEIRYIRCAQNS